MSKNVSKNDTEISLFFFYSNFCKMHKHDIENKTNTSGDLPEEIPLITESKK